MRSFLGGQMRRNVTAFILSTALLAAPLGGQPAPKFGKEAAARFGYVLTAAKWLTYEIPVCWEDPADSLPADRALVQQAIKDSWGAKSKVRFTEWDRCQPNEKGVHIAVRDEAPQALALGRKLSGRPRGLTLNFAMTLWRPQHCALDERDKCIRATAIHEFGHVLGFSHEQNRADRPDWCKEAPQGANGDYFATVYDPNSIMNYCNVNWTGQGGLSKLDIEAVNKVYI